MGFNFAGKHRPVPKEIFKDDILGTIRVFGSGLEFDDNFFPNYGGVEFKFVTEKGVMIPARINRAGGFDIAYEEFSANREQILTHLRRIRSFEKLIMNEILRDAENDTLEQIAIENEEFVNGLVSLTISVTVILENAVAEPDDASVSSNVRILSENSGVNLSTAYYVDLSEGKIDRGASYTDHE